MIRLTNADRRETEPAWPNARADGWPDEAAVRVQLERWYATENAVLWVIGPPGCGKTTLMLCWLSDMRARGHSCLFFDGPLARQSLPHPEPGRRGHADRLGPHRA